jgi:hypothetical protein
VYQAFEIELAFDFVVKNYLDIEKYVAEHLVLDMAGQIDTVDAFRLQRWGFVRTLNNWLGSINFWNNFTQKCLSNIYGRGATELQCFKDSLAKLRNDKFVIGFLFFLRDYSQHWGFPPIGPVTGPSWNRRHTELTFSANYTLSYDDLRPYCEGRRDSKSGKFGKKIEAYGKGEPFDLKPIIRQALGFLGQFMDGLRSSMEERVHATETFVTDLIERYTSAHSGVSIIPLSAMPVDDRKIGNGRADVVPVRDEFILRAQELRRKNNGKTLASMGKRLISNR